MSHKLVKRLQLRPKQPSADEPEFLLAASGAKMPNIGTVEVDVFIQGLVIPFSFCVLNNLTHDCIFGMDFLTSSGAEINLAQQSLTLYDGLVVAALINRVDRSELVRLAQSITIPPKTEAIVPVMLHGKH